MFVLGKIYHERQGKEQETVCDHEVDHVHPGLSPALEFAAEDPEGDCVQQEPKGEDWDVDDQLKQQNTVLQRAVYISAVLHGGLSLQEKGAGERPSSGTGPAAVPSLMALRLLAPLPHARGLLAGRGAMQHAPRPCTHHTGVSGEGAWADPQPPKQRCSPPADTKLQRETPPTIAVGWQPVSDLRPGLPSLQLPFRVLATAESLQSRLTIS